MRKGRLIARVAAGAVALSAVLGVATTSTAATSDTPPKGQNCWATHYGYIPPGSYTASGEIFDNNKDTAATSLSRSPQLPFGTKVKVTNVANGKSLVVRVNDRGTFGWTPSVPKCLDLTDGAYGRLGGVLNPDSGHIVVKEEVVQ
ncbi:septal ring lytic transglycosylase RlpA family protein [Streptomyces sp. NPDC021212]|uniref:septal ring lytic transglycosylase RlpA family protein n=1 Tax=Streptomyces sp. NPDC021212 TaxID=3365118 RepID=UPI003799911B